jgi:CubicO group peptidase (beta-lactamase class C family)
MKAAISVSLCAVALALAVVTASTPAAKPEDVGLSSERLQRISQMVQRRIDAHQLAGAVTAVARRGKVAHMSAQGVMDLESKQPMTQATMFRIASMTKPVIAVAIMMLVEEGRLRLTDPVSRHIPEFHAMKVGAERVAAVRDITVKDLLTHVSGLGSGPVADADIAKVARKEGERLADYIPRLGTTTLEFQPGSRWTYSPGAGFETLGRIVEIASGMPLDQFFRRRIFDPLGMQDIAFWPSAAQWPLVATVYGRSGNGLAKAATPNDTMSRNVYFRGSGGLYSTAQDYIPFGMMLANGGELNGTRLLSRKAVEMMTAAHVPDTLPGRPAGEGYGLGVRVVTNHAVRGTMLSDGTYGWSGAQGTHFFVDPKEQLVGVMMVQTSNPGAGGEFEDLVAQSIID